MTVVALLQLPVALTSDKFLVGVSISFFLIGWILYILGILNALDEEDYLLRERVKVCGVVILLGAVAMVVCSVLFSILGKDLSGSDFLFVEWTSFIVSSIVAAVLHCRRG